jgi:ABC-type methionine transport system permease subunit
MYPVEMRATPTINSLSGNFIYSPVVGGKTITSVSLVGASATGTTLSTAGSTGLTAHDNYVMFNTTITFSAEL